MPSLRDPGLAAFAASAFVPAALAAAGALRRLSIGRKLVGLVSVLLLLMLLAAAYSFYRATVARRDAEGLSERLIPLAASLSGMDAAVTSQEVAFERALRHLTDPAVEAEALEADLAAFRRLGEAAREAIREAKREAGRSAEAARVTEDVQQLADVQASLRMLQRDQTQFTQSGLEVLEAIRASRGQQVPEGEAALLVYRERSLGSEVGRLRDLLRELTDGFNRYIAARSERVGVEQARRFDDSLRNFALTGAAFLFGVLMAIAITRLIVRPLRDLVTAAQRVQDGDLDVEVKVRTDDEVGELAGAFNTMVAGLRARERVKEAFGKYLDPRIVEDVIGKVDLAEAEGERRVMTVFFSDVAGFSTIAEQLTPSGLVKIINRYFTLATEPIVRRQGVVDKYIGDAIMAYWGPPFTSEEDHARLACEAALDQLEQLDELRRQLPELLGFRTGLPRIDIRVGLSTGDLVVGNIGSERSKSYTVMGDTVNVASRLEGVNKQYGTRILLAEETWARLGDGFETREIDLIAVVGKKEPTRIFQLLARKGGLEPRAAELRDAFEQGLRAYRERAFDRAARAMETCLAIDPEDGPARVFSDRIRQLRDEPPEESWDGVWRLSKK